MIRELGHVIVLGEDCEPFVQIQDESGKGLVPVRLRGEQENLTPAWRGHEVINLEWFEIQRYTDESLGAAPQWGLLADHDITLCDRCALRAEAEHRDALLGEIPFDDWESAADRAQAFHRDYLMRWSEEPGPLDPSLDHPLRRQRARIRVDDGRLYEWLEIAARYVHTLMYLVWKEEDRLSLTRSSLQYLYVFGVFKANEDEQGPIFEHEGTTWRVDANGNTQRLTETGNDESPLTCRFWVDDPAGRGLPGWHDARDRALTLQSERAQIPEQRRALPEEFDMAGRERRIAEQTRSLRLAAAELRLRLMVITCEIRGA